MNYLAVDYGQKHIGIAIAINNVISPLCVLDNNKMFLNQLKKIINDYKIDKLFIGIPEGVNVSRIKKMAQYIKKNIDKPLEYVEEAVSTIEASEIYIANKNPKKGYKSNIDAVSAAVILRRAI